MMFNIKVTSDELDVVKGLVGQEMDSVRVIELKDPKIETDYTRILSRLDTKLSQV